MQRCRLESIGVSYPNKRHFKSGSLNHAVWAGRTCVEKSKHLARDIQLLINTGIHRDDHYAEPAFAAFIQKKLGINAEFQGRKTLSFDLQNSGCGMLSAAYVITTMIQSGSVQVGMAISSEANSDKKPDPNYTYPESGAAIIVDVSPTSSEGFGGFVFKTFEKYRDLYSSVVSLLEKRGRLLVRKKQGLEEAYLQCVEPVLSELLQHENLELADIDYLIPSQISDGFLKNLADKISFPLDKIVNTTHLFADTLTTSVFLGLQYLMDQEPIAPGKKVVLLTFGAGITVGATIYYF
ncbi:MAG: hypothetical protein HQ510_04695 [Candidatus Marinimicrobia bacterium]|nr:hypothetical protein [Candidatus Neomarinimicrobiota bacterium]